MRQDFSSDPARQVPNIPCPDFLKMKWLGELTDDGFHAAAGSRELLDDPEGTGIPSSTVWSSISPLLFNKNKILNEKPDRFVVARL